tara:strand:- start:29 stop:997 length:969 start_codon:yes stop_codon:yes gene_type:complete
VKTTEAKLRQIVLEEVQLHLLDIYINEELDKIFEQDEDDDELADYKKAKRQAMYDKIKKGAMAAGLAGLVGGGLQSQVSDLGQQRAAASAERQAQSVAAANTDEAQLEDFADQLNNRYRFLWGKGEDMAVYYPGTDGKVTVLPPSYSIAVQAFLDKKANAKRMDQGLPPILRYGEIDYENLRPASTDYSGDFEQNIDTFIDEYSGDMIDAMALLKAVPELQVVAGAGTEEAIVMANPSSIDSDYYLPAVGMTAQQYYDSQYGGFMGDQEREAIEDAGSEEVVTPDVSELNPELVQKTKERAADLKESKITWKNYKNRKKKLA